MHEQSPLLSDHQRLKTLHHVLTHVNVALLLSTNAEVCPQNTADNPASFLFWLQKICKPATRYLCLGTRRQHVTCALALAGSTLPVPWHSPAGRYLCLGTRRQHVTCALALAGSTLPVPSHSPAARYLCLGTSRQHVTCALALAGSSHPSVYFVLYSAVCATIF